MININNKSWHKLRYSDIEKFLSSQNDENFFFEFKSDDISSEKFIKEVSAFANTYGGYIFLGINDDKTIGGCSNWNEQRIHVTIHDSITPVPNFDVKKLKNKTNTVYIIKVDEGLMPPYVTNKGQIFERVSSGSFQIKDAYKLNLLYSKQKDNIHQIKNKIELKEIQTPYDFPKNIYGYIDIGFSVTCSEHTELENNFYDFDFQNISKHLSNNCPAHSISRVGYSYVFTLGEVFAKDELGNHSQLPEGLHNFIEVMPDGSVKCRIILSGDVKDDTVDIFSINLFIFRSFREIYKMIFGDNFYKIFLNAQKYEKLTVINQFVPIFRATDNDDNEYKQITANHFRNHKNKYGNNLIVIGNRYPRNNFLLIDRRLFTKHLKYNNENLLTFLFSSTYLDLGYIDDM